MNTRVVRTVEELLEVIPEIMGFTPTDSLVIVGHNGFTSRVDVPIGPDEISDVAASFEPALKHMSDEVTVVVYGYDQTWVDENVPDMMFEILPGIRVRHMIAAPEDPAGLTRQRSWRLRRPSPIRWRLYVWPGIRGEMGTELWPTSSWITWRRWKLPPRSRYSGTS